MVAAVKLIAMMVVRNEADRYLRPCIKHLLDFCDEIRVLNDGSDDGTFAILESFGERVQARTQVQGFYQNEGMTRQALLEWTMEGGPTHILAIDADEFVSDGQAIRRAVEKNDSHTGVWKLRMSEVWKADEEHLLLRHDGQWSPRPIGIVFKVPEMGEFRRQNRRHWRIPPVQLASGRTPILVTQASNRTTTDPICDILHLGWACEADRAARYERYVVHDGGAFHQSKHLDSIMWTDAQVRLFPVNWPQGLPKDVLLQRINRGI